MDIVVCIIVIDIQLYTTHSLLVWLLSFGNENPCPLWFWQSSFSIHSVVYSFDFIANQLCTTCFCTSGCFHSVVFNVFFVVLTFGIQRSTTFCLTGTTPCTIFWYIPSLKIVVFQHVYFCKIPIYISRVSCIWSFKITILSLTFTEI